MKFMLFAVPISLHVATFDQHGWQWVLFHSGLCRIRILECGHSNNACWL